MVGHRRILRSFLADASRLGGEAGECLNQLLEQRRQLARVSPAHVQDLLRAVHTLKGTSSMVHGGEPVVQALHELETRLCGRALIDLAARPDWLDDAVRCVEQARGALGDLQARERIAVARSGPTGVELGGAGAAETERGVVLRIRWDQGAQPVLHWLALDEVERALGPVEVAKRAEEGKEAEAGLPSPSGVALALRSGAGRVLLHALEVVGWMSWAEAEQRGVTRGLRTAADLERVA